MKSFKPATLNNNQEPGSRGEIVIYTTKDGQAKLEVRLDEETVWLTQAHMAELFGKNVRTVNEHVQNIFKEGELEKDAVIRNFRITARDGKAYNTNFYNLDVIISVGYRIKSQRGTQFRIWATKTLKDYLVKGYAVNQNRLLEQTEKLRELQQAISFIQNKANYPELQDQAQELLSIINEYSTSLTLLYQYDEGTLSLTRGAVPGFVLNYEKSRKLIDQLKVNLAAKGEASGLFGSEIGLKLKAIIGTVYQTFSGEDLYPSIEEKAANLLYLTIKDHPFTDGNKRIGSLLFIYFLEQNRSILKQSGERKISDTALVALALLIAISNPKEKDVIIKIVTNLLKS